MKKNLIALCMLFILSIIFSTVVGAATKEQPSYIGLHDRVLKFDQKEIHQVEKKLFVPFNQLMDYLYAEVTHSEIVTAVKNDHIIAYQIGTGITTVDGKESNETPIQTINGELYADVAFIAENFGFHFQYYEDLNVSRIFSDTYKSLSGSAYEKHMKTLLKIPDRHIGLHDRLLKFKQEEIRLVKGELFVPFDQIMEHLYAEVSGSKTITATKNDHVLTYQSETGTTTVNGEESDGTPIQTINGKLYADLAFIAKNFGFHFQYHEDLNVSRIFSDSYKSLRGTAYEKHIKDLLNPAPPIVKPQKANVYLTFDDGPTRFTTINAATLKKYQVKGTFFFQGSQMNIYPETVKEVAKEGHYLGSHSMTHEQRKVYGSTTTFMNEMSSARALIKKLTGQDPLLIRVPYGSQPHVTTSMKNALKKEAYKMWDWDVDSNDWRYTDNQYRQIVKNVRTGVEKAFKSGDREIVVLLHDRSQTAKALPEIITWLQKEGYTLKAYDPAHHVVQNFHKDAGL